MKKILACVGTRPNFIKIVKLEKLFAEAGFEYRILHTGQHFDQKMSDVFFHQLKLRKPDYYLGIGGGSNNEVVGKIIVETEKILLEYKPDILIVPGDVNSTFACAFAAASLRIPVGHIESGLRSGDMDMPEERNRILTDSLSDLLFVTEPVGVDFLRKAGVDEKKIKLVGNTIVDALTEMLPVVDDCKVLDELGVAKPYAVVTFHRPVNVDDEKNLGIIVDALARISVMMQVVFPIHPRTLKRLEATGLKSKIDNPNIKLTEPLGYIEFLKLMKESVCIISDSGGVQIESSYFNIPCFTVRDTTELKITIEEGTNRLMELDAAKIAAEVKQVIDKPNTPPKQPWLWDGKASERIVEEVKSFLIGR
ncbi:MAG TPA: UDP-N-acetylglucosamine 2-epimerase (non-hydrolyzing) [Chitinophagales bacterium]|nr:UDP-N-acetylglucosamine 2-epimerase (non-hydrolyzing) [Chitinophagales bacterium]